MEPENCYRPREKLGAGIYSGFVAKYLSACPPWKIGSSWRNCFLGMVVRMEGFVVRIKCRGSETELNLKTIIIAEYGCPDIWTLRFLRDR